MPKPSPPKKQKPSVVFPDIAPKSQVECQTLLEDQIILLDNIFSPGECKSFVKFIDSLPLELTPPKKRGEAERHNYRHSITSTEFAARLYEMFGPHLPFAAHSFNSNIRVYKYTESQHFGPHYDDDYRDAITGAKSQWTLLLYLTGYEDGVQGGEVVDHFFLFTHLIGLRRCSTRTNKSSKPPSPGELLYCIDMVETVYSTRDHPFCAA
ncbi:hypothetical protein FB45DRAFT_1026664 [Roridomyces roridus]|uniref:Prolyl 4-hydroxylase alpha subunit domain-containing protein n=1 Tax=Roridomyces roridus TaxID=1738132 RepID=A0AAD7BWI3_9AGAR|nr:hypothetical protein FB45DRAFT_1026664 [Roridomyces roridus]